MHQSPREGRIEDDGKPVVDHVLSVDEARACRCLHPAIGGKNPEGGNHRADGDETGGEKMKARSNLLPAEKHDSQKTGLEEKCRQHLEADQGPQNGSCDTGPFRPVCSELIGKDETGNDAHAEGESEDLDPETIKDEPDFVAGTEIFRFEENEEARKTDRQRGEQNMKGDGEGKLEPGENFGVERRHGTSPASSKMLP